MVAFRMRNFLCDFSLLPPTILDTHAPGKGDIPVVHIFGATENGSKACVHIHGALPYLMIRVGGELTDRVRALMAKKLNYLLHTDLSRKKPVVGEKQEKVPQYIHHLEPIQAKSLYGFHSRIETFAKIYLTNPYHVLRLSSVLGQHAAENPMMQPFEAHVPFILQLFIDNSIFGMDWISFSNVKYRISHDRPDADILYGDISVSSVKENPNLLSPLFPSSTCWVELDVYVSDILNSQLYSKNVHSSNPGLEYIWKEEEGRCKLQNRELIDTFNQYTPRPYPVIRSETEALSLLDYVATKMKDNANECLEENLNDSRVSSPLNGSYTEGKDAEEIWSQAFENTGFQLDEAKMETEEYHEEEKWDDEEDYEEEECDINEMSMLVHEAGVQNHVTEGERIDRPRSSVEMANVGNEDSEEHSLNYPEAQFGGVWIKPRTQLPFRRRLKKKKRIKIVPAPVAAPPPVVATGAAKVQPTMRNRMLFVNDSVERTDLAKTISPDNLAATDGHIEETKDVCVASLELFAFTQHKMPDPTCDPIVAASLCIASNACCSEVPSFHQIITVMSKGVVASKNMAIYVEDELQLLEKIAELVNSYDPDMLIGYDIDRLSWGYLLKRNEALGGGDSFSRKLGRYVTTRKPWQRDPLRMPEIDGRIVQSVWRTVRRDLQLRSYDRGAACFYVLKKRIPMLNDKALTEIYTNVSAGAGRQICFHLQRLSQVNISLLYHMDWFIRNAEMARVYGIQFHEVWTRGSQLRVESMLLRLAHKLNFVVPSVTVEQRDKMCAPEQLQLIMEPESNVYHDPVIVLDFQSLYPSMVIAYNYCFSTLFGKIPNLAAAADVNAGYIDVGALQYAIDKNVLIEATSSGEIHSSPLSSAFSREVRRQGVVPIMLREILGARVMVKTAMKHTQSRRLLKILEARQLALKLVANVTYGYAAANWSGRMPCVEVADAILSKGRETLERAIAHVNDGDYGGARVIYGDTDSMFVLVPGATVKEAFEFGRRIAAAVTADNPAPVVLKLEKVYSGCVLETKKRYAGWMFETENDAPKLDAKGIETVRRDTCPLVAKILERSLELILQRQYGKFYGYLNRKMSSLHNLHFSEFVFCKEFRGEYDENAPVPQKKVAQYFSDESPGFFPLRGERLPYVIVTGDPNSTVISCVRSLDEFISDPDLKINVAYYVRAHVLAALRRVTDLVPISIKYIDESVQNCFGDGCTSGNIPWCSSCIVDDKSYTFAMLNVAREQRIMSAVRQVCTDCQHSREVDIEACENVHCTMHRLISSISRSMATMALFQHDHMFDANETLMEMENIEEEEAHHVEREEMEESTSENEDEEEYRPNSTLFLVLDDDEFSRL